MKRTVRNLLCAGALALLFLAAAPAFTPSRIRAADAAPAPQTSPSGKYVLVVVEGKCPACGPFRQFDVMTGDRDPRILYASTDHFRTRDTTWFGWGEGDRVWVYSGDVGTFYWEPAAGGAWRKGSYSDGKHPAPEALKRFRPQLFKR